MRLHLPTPRLLPMTIGLLAVLLFVKTVGLVRLAVAPIALAAPEGAAAGGAPAGGAPAGGASPAATPEAPPTAAIPIAVPPTAAMPTAAPPTAAIPTAPPPMAASPAAAPPMAAPPMATPAAGAAGGTPAPQAGTTAAAHPAAAGTAPAAAPGLVKPIEISDSERAILLDLRKRREDLDARERDYAGREAVIAAAEHRLTQRVGELQALQVKLEALEAARVQREEANWRGLVKVYESMKPRDAATIFNDLEMQVLLPVLDRMKETKAAPVLAAMQPDKARQATTNLAQLRLKQTAPPNGS